MMKIRRAPRVACLVIYAAYRQPRFENGGDPIRAGRRKASGVGLGPYFTLANNAGAERVLWLKRLEVPEGGACMNMPNLDDCDYHHSARGRAVLNCPQVCGFEAPPEIIVRSSASVYSASHVRSAITNWYC